MITLRSVRSVMRGRGIGQPRYIKLAVIPEMRPLVG